MAWTARNVNSATGASVSLAVTAGDLIVVLGVRNDGSPSMTIDDTVNSYAQQISHSFTGADGRCAPSIWSAIAATTATLTITLTGAGAIEAVHAGAFYHGTDTPVQTADTTGFVDADSTQSVTLTTSVANTLLIGFSDAGTANDPGSGFTTIGNTIVTLRMESEYNGADNSSGSNVVNTINGSPNRGLIAAAFKYTVAGGGGTPSRARTIFVMP